MTLIEAYVDCQDVFENLDQLGAISNLADQYNPLFYSLLMLQGLLALLLVVLYLLVIGMGSDAIYLHNQFEYEKLPNPLN